MFQCAVHQPRAQAPPVGWGDLTESCILQDLLEMVGARVGALTIGGKAIRRFPELLRDIRDHRGWSGGELIGGKAKIAQGAKLQRESEPVVSTALSLHLAVVLLRKREVVRDITR